MREAIATASSTFSGESGAGTVERRRMWFSCSFRGRIVGGETAVAPARADHRGLEGELDEAFENAG